MGGISLQRPQDVLQDTLIDFIRNFLPPGACAKLREYWGGNEGQFSIISFFACQILESHESN